MREVMLSAKSDPEPCGKQEDDDLQNDDREVDRSFGEKERGEQTRQKEQERRDQNEACGRKILAFSEEERNALKKALLRGFLHRVSFLGCFPPSRSASDGKRPPCP